MSDRKPEINLVPIIRNGDKIYEFRNLDHIMETYGYLFSEPEKIKLINKLTEQANHIDRSTNERLKAEVI